MSTEPPKRSASKPSRNEGKPSRGHEGEGRGTSVGAATGELPIVARREDPTVHRGYAHGTDPRRWKILTVLLVAIFMSLVAVSIINVGLPSIQHGFGASEAQIQWVLSGYALTFGVVLVAAGRAGDIFGRGFMFVLGVTIFTLSSVAAWLASDPNMLIAARFAQGFGSGLLNPQGVAMIQQYFKGAERGKAFGMFGSTVGVSVAIGPVLGGLLIQAGGQSDGWRYMFLVNVPVGILALILAFKWFPKPLLRKPKNSSLWRSFLDMDPIGALLLGLAILAMLLPFIEAGSPTASPWLWLLVGVAVAFLLLWSRWESHFKAKGNAPMVDLNIFKVKSFLNGTVLIGLYFLGITSVWVIITLYMQQGLGHTALASGTLGIPNAIASAISANVAGRYVTQMGRKVVVLGMSLALLGLGLSIAVIQLQELELVSEWWLMATLCFVGLGQGMVVSPNQTLTLADVPLEYAGSSGGIMQTGQRIGTSIGIAMITAVLFGVMSDQGWAWGMTAAMSLIMMVVFVALMFAIRDMRYRQKQASAR